MSGESETGEKLYPYLYEGTVIDVADPLNLHRVRCSIEGVCAQSAWCRPRTGGGGGPQRGGNAVPPVGCTVFVQFVLGEIEQPVYSGGSWGTPDEGSEVPKDITAAKSDAPLISAWEFQRKDTITGAVYTVRLTLDERPHHRSIRLVAATTPAGANPADKKPEAVIGSIELDLENRVLDLFATTGIQLRSKGFIDIRALTSRIQRRRVRRTGDPL